MAKKSSLSQLAWVRDVKSYARPYKRAVLSVVKGRYNEFARQVQLPLSANEPSDAQWKRVLKNSAPLLADLPRENGPRVLFASGYGFGRTMLLLESIYAMALRLRGASPSFAFCDEVLPACEFNRFGNSRPDPGAFGAELTARTKLDACRTCIGNVQDVLKFLPIPRTTFRKYLQPGDLERALGFAEQSSDALSRQAEYRGVNVAEHAYASVMRNTFRGTFEPTEEMLWLYRRYLAASVLLVDLTERLLDDVRPDRVVVVHGVYVTHGTIADVARQRGLHVIVHGNPFRLNTVWLSHHDTYHRALVSEPTTHWETMPWDVRKERVVDEYISTKRFGSRDYASYHLDAINDPDVLYQSLGLRRDRPIVSLFSNVIWDAQLFFKYNAFDNVLHWIFETIRYFASRPELQLVIRIHPAEAKAAMPTNQPLLPEIQARFPELAGNIKIIPSESKLSSYTLAEQSAAALIYGARMGSEIAILGTPLVIAGETYNRRKGFSYDVETREEYFRLLDRIEQLPRNTPQMIERAKKYAYHYYFRLMMDFPLVKVANALHLSDPRLEFDSLASLMPGGDKTLDHICRAIVDGKTPFFFDRLEAYGEYA